VTAERFESFLVFLVHAKFILSALKYYSKKFRHMDYVFVKVIGRGIMRKRVAENFNGDSNASAKLG
jgi:hypothetical protein